MSSPPTTTIAAIASPPGAGERGLIRISGPGAGAIVARACRLPGSDSWPRGRGWFLARFHDGRGEQPAMVLWMPAPRSFTREDVVELHLPGSPHLLAWALRRLLELGCEPAAPGEFTRRAFESGRIDLSRAEGVLALVDATAREQRRAATALLLGGLERRVDELREGLDELRALCEASLDFDESDTGHVPVQELRARAADCRAAIEEAGAWEGGREPRTAIPTVLLSGPPNAGKSSLFNRLTRSGCALVSPEPGTTRDVIEGSWSLGGVELRLLDSAGEDTRALGPDAQAQERAQGEARAADLLLRVVDASEVCGAPAVGESWGVEGDGDAARVLGVWNKVDLPGVAPEPPPTRGEDRLEWVSVSARTGIGLERLARAVARRLGIGPEAGPGGMATSAVPGEAGGSARDLTARHGKALDAALAALLRAERGLAEDVPLDLVAQDLREAGAALDAITGRTAPDDLLDRIFARFCLGK